ncbi:MAG: tRNA (adenosine(37)-N6)-threonylcarbamoyltransferase complex ATPase subunit type 1 TsaE [Candidatus Pedobacter colombiensis]|uniref:tRNA threonylcarbamoyladenosine biosynthesis protein TsaE n=1 Tax=Candidatus Pedobacter colombiensis TaxID=3121371 RepID=A0AAJ5W7A5_9SPHI|nr:tRNA (adenosine(37)-N6)-threonylcarbamoyltransferase complex ATPase subunit type 1 TsaE [Pedobacter sp.]WEK19314.1 MAG: tRNA (adenosine(37)-N6)-threonylcarbamoyltransferase complex ATPase subunit type 1 TsaE [Pedobacter sp.]
MENIKIEVNGLDGLENAAKKIVTRTQDDHIFIFEGEMGAGKTTLIKALAKELGVTKVVSSPTFSIVNEYDAQGKVIYHFDFYRIKNLQEAYDIGYEEYFYSGNICFIEWPEKIEPLLPQHYVKIEISVQNENDRILSISKI